MNVVRSSNGLEAVWPERYGVDVSTIEEIEAAVRKLPAEDQYRLAQRLQDVLWEAWDRQIEEDARAGRLDSLLAEVEADIAAGRTKPLDEIVDHS